jgi:hypothetical protein
VGAYVRFRRCGEELVGTELVASLSRPVRGRGRLVLCFWGGESVLDLPAVGSLN